MDLADLIDDDRPDLFTGEARLLRLPGCYRLTQLPLGQRLRRCLYGLCIGYGLHKVLKRLRPWAVRLMFVDDIECGAKRCLGCVVPRSDQASKVRKAGSALNHELQRAGRTCRLDLLNINEGLELYKTKPAGLRINADKLSYFSTFTLERS